MEPHCALKPPKHLFKNKTVFIITLITDSGLIVRHRIKKYVVLFLRSKDIYNFLNCKIFCVIFTRDCENNWELFLVESRETRVERDVFAKIRDFFYENVEKCCKLVFCLLQKRYCFVCFC